MKDIAPNQKAYEKAKKRVAVKFGFYIHLIVFIAVLLSLLLINLSNNPDYLWVKWPFLGWGIGLLVHGLNVFVFSQSPSTMEKMMNKELKKEGW